MREAPSSPRTDDTTLVGNLVSTVRGMIVRGEIPGGGRVNEHALAGRLGVSRTALREAARLLERSNLVTIEPNRGVFVRNITLKQALDLFDVRASLARTAAGLAATRATEAQLHGMATLHDAMSAQRADRDFAAYYDANLRFHAAIMEATGNDRLVQLDDLMWWELQLFRRRDLGHAGHLDASGAEHARILSALVARDPARAGRAAERHVQSGARRMLDMMGLDA